MIFLSLILDILLALGYGVGTIEATHGHGDHGHAPGLSGHSVHGHVVVEEHHGRHGHTAPPSGHEPQPHNPGVQ